MRVAEDHRAKTERRVLVPFETELREVADEPTSTKASKARVTPMGSSAGANA